MLFKNGEAFCLGWMSRQHRFNPDLVELRRDQRLRNPGLVKFVQMICPETRFAGQTDLGFPGTADLCGDVFLDHIQELEGNGIGLAESRIGREIDSDLVNPRQIGGEMTFAEFLENLPETIHQKGQIIVNFLKTACDILFFHLWVHPLLKAPGNTYLKNGGSGKEGCSKIHMLFTAAEESAPQEDIHNIIQ